MDAFDEMYRAGSPPWDIGAPQPAFVGLEADGRLGRRVLDAGCGTGENALHFAARGHTVTGIDGSPTAIERAEAKARQRGLAVDFRVHDALRLADLRETFDSVTDCGLFHVFEDRDRPRYAAAVRAVLRSGGNLSILCFSEREPGDWGPRRVSQKEIEATFSKGWKIESVEPSKFESNLGMTAQAWLARMRAT